MACQDCSRVYCKNECVGSRGTFHYQDKQRKNRRRTIIQKRSGLYEGMYGHTMIGCSSCGEFSIHDECEMCKKF